MCFLHALRCVEIVWSLLETLSLLQSWASPSICFVSWHCLYSLLWGVTGCSYLSHCQNHTCHCQIGQSETWLSVSGSSIISTISFVFGLCHFEFEVVSSEVCVKTSNTTNMTRHLLKEQQTKTFFFTENLWKAQLFSWHTVQLESHKIWPIGLKS